MSNGTHHHIEETITGTIYRTRLLAFLMSEGLIPKTWERCKIEVRQFDAAAEIEFTAKRNYPAPKETPTPADGGDKLKSE